MRKLITIIIAVVMVLALIPAVVTTPSAHAETVTGEYIPRTTAPSKTNLFFIKTTHGGHNCCIIIDSKTGEVTPNCVGYAWGRVYEIVGIKPLLSKGNAQNWYGYKDGYARGSKPRLGAVICWNRNGNGYGHVAVVEKIEDNKITISQSHYGGKKFDTKVIAIGKESSYVSGFQGYIYACDFTVKYDANGGTGTMASHYVTYGVDTKITANLFTKANCVFAGWTLQRKSDGCWFYKSADGTATGWYLKGKQPAGYAEAVYKDESTIAKTVKPGDTVTFSAIWNSSPVQTPSGLANYKNEDLPLGKYVLRNRDNNRTTVPAWTEPRSTETSTSVNWQNGTIITVVETKKNAANNWWVRTASGKWIYSENVAPYVVPAESSLGAGVYCTKKTISVYTDPSSQTLPVKVLEANARVIIIATHVNSAGNKWGKIASGEWVYMENLQLCG